MDLSSLEVTSRVFEEDMRKQGLYVPPMLIQSLEDRTNEVTGTYTCDSSGNTQEMPGGILGAIPGAPEAFNAANVAQMKSLGLDRKPKGRKRKQTTRTQGDSDKEENKKVAGAGFNVSAEQDVKGKLIPYLIMSHFEYIPLILNVLYHQQIPIILASLGKHSKGTLAVPFSKIMTPHITLLAQNTTQGSKLKVQEIAGLGRQVRSAWG